MAIEYALYPNPLTDDPNDHRTVVQNQTSRNLEDIIERMISRGSTITRSDALSVIEEFEAAVASFISEGDRINTSLFNMGSSVSGNFAGSKDHFDPARHELRLNISAGRRLRILLEDMRPQKTESA